MDSNFFALVGLGVGLQVLTIVLCLRRAQADGHSSLMWGLLAFFIWPLALLALVVIKPEPRVEPAIEAVADATGTPLASPVEELPVLPAPPLAPNYEYVAPPDDAGMSVYTPFILNGVGLLLLFGLTRGDGDTLGAFLLVLVLLLAINTGLSLKAFTKGETGLAVCYFLVMSAGSVLLLWIASSWGHR